MNSEQNSYQAGIECLDRVVAKLKPETSTRMKSAIIALYSADDLTNLRYSQQIVLLHLDYDRLLKSYLLRLYHLQSLVLLLQFELYYGFASRYKLVQTSGIYENLYLFDLLQEGFLGFQFRNKQQAEIFNSKLRQAAPTMQTFREIQMKKMQEALKKKKDSSFFGSLKKKIFRQSPIQEEETKVLKVTKTKSIHYNKQGQIITENLPPEWLEVFNVCGVTKADLRNPQIAQMIVEETIMHEAKKAALKDGTLLDKVGIKSMEQLEYVKEEEEDNRQDTLVQKSTLQSSQQLVREPLSNERAQIQQKLNLVQQPVISLPLPPPPLGFLPPPPPPPPLSPPTANRISKNAANIIISMRRENLLEQIRNNKIKLKPVQTGPLGIHLDISLMNREQRKDLGDQLRLKLQKRRLYAKARKSSSEDDD